MKPMTRISNHNAPIANLRLKGLIHPHTSATNDHPQVASHVFSGFGNKDAPRKKIPMEMAANPRCGLLSLKLEMLRSKNGKLLHFKIVRANLKFILFSSV